MSEVRALRRLFAGSGRMLALSVGTGLVQSALLIPPPLLLAVALGRRLFRRGPR